MYIIHNLFFSCSFLHMCTHAHKPRSPRRMMLPITTLINITHGPKNLISLEYNLDFEYIDHRISFIRNGSMDHILLMWILLLGNVPVFKQSDYPVTPASTYIRGPVLSTYGKVLSGAIRLSHYLKDRDSRDL